MGSFYPTHPSADGFPCSVLPSRQELSATAVKSHESAPSLLGQSQGSWSTYSWSKCCRSPGCGLANTCLDGTRMSRGRDVPRHWASVTRHKRVGLGESQRLLRDVVWPPIFSCFVSSCLLHTSWCVARGADAPPTKAFLQWLFAAHVSMYLVFFFLLAIFSPPRTVNYCALLPF